MTPECNQQSFEFHSLDQWQVAGRFDGGAITTDAGGLLLRQVEKRTEILERFADCFRDHRAAGQVEHPVGELVAQRVYGLPLGYEDLNDHEQLRREPLLAVLAEKPDPTGGSRARRRDPGKALAGKSTLKRLELTAVVVKEKERSKKISREMEAVDRLLVEVFLEAHRRPPAEIVLDPDATDDPLHGNQIHPYFSSMAYVLVQALRRLGLKQTELARARVSTIRPKRLKIGALVRVTVRRVWISMAGGDPYAELFAQAWARLQASPAPR